MTKCTAVETWRYFFHTERSEVWWSEAEFAPSSLRSSLTTLPIRAWNMDSKERRNSLWTIESQPWIFSEGGLLDI